MKAVLVSSLVVLIAAGLAGCRSVTPEPEKDYDAPLPPGQPALRLVTDPAEIPDFTVACTDRAGLREASAHSLSYLGKASSKTFFPSPPFTHDDAVATLSAFDKLLESGKSPAEMNEIIRRDFEVYTSVGCDGEGTVLFTGYFTPILDASMTKTDRFKYPLYKPPKDLVKLPDGSPSKPMPDRRTIEEQNLYAGNELVWLADPFDAYVVQVQGSSKLRMPDGDEITVGYAANNGHEYQSIRAELVRSGKIGKRGGMPAIMDYFHANPDQVREYTWRNPRYVFFAIQTEGTPHGCLNEAVTPMRTVATDKKIFPRGCLTFVSATLPRRMLDGSVRLAPYHGFGLDQDAGGAIRAAGRCDVYMGIGPEAGERAGRAQNEGRLYYLRVKAPAAN